MKNTKRAKGEKEQKFFGRYTYLALGTIEAGCAVEHKSPAGTDVTSVKSSLAEFACIARGTIVERIV